MGKGLLCILFGLSVICICVALLYRCYRRNTRSEVFIVPPIQKNRFFFAFGITLITAGLFLLLEISLLKSVPPEQAISLSEQFNENTSGDWYASLRHALFFAATMSIFFPALNVPVLLYKRWLKKRSMKTRMTYTQQKSANFVEKNKKESLAASPSYDIVVSEQDVRRK